MLDARHAWGLNLLLEARHGFIVCIHTGSKLDAGCETWFAIIVHTLGLNLLLDADLLWLETPGGI